MVGLEVLLEAEFLCGNQSFFPITNERREGKGLDGGCSVLF